MAKEGTPVDKEFATGRLDPRLREYARRFLRDYDMTNAPAAAAPAVGFLDTSAEHGMVEVETAAELERVLAKGGYQFESVLPIDEDAGPAARFLITRLAYGMPVSSVSATPPRDALRGVDVRVNAILVCRALRASMRHLYDPVRDAVVFAKSMGDTGRQFGGNSSDAAVNPIELRGLPSAVSSSGASAKTRVHGGSIGWSTPAARQPSGGDVHERSMPPMNPGSPVEAVGAPVMPERYASVGADFENPVKVYTWVTRQNRKHSRRRPNIRDIAASRPRL